MEKSVIAWTDVACGASGNASLAFTALKDVTCNKAEYDTGGPNANIIIFQDHKWAYTGLDNTLAKTTVTYDADSGEILDADLEFNHAFNEYTTGDDHVIYDLQSIATHEFGHFLGLDHTPNFLATMFAGYSEGSTDLRTIEPDDMDAMCTVYPPTRKASCSPQPKGGFNRDCADSDSDDDSCSVASATKPQSARGSAWLILFAVGWLVRRRRVAAEYS
jgi:MYXO-CTERM domain-containing protein